MNAHVNAISNRLSLRPPQRDSLEILARICEIVSLSKDGDPAEALETIKSEFGTVEDELAKVRDAGSELYTRQSTVFGQLPGAAEMAAQQMRCRPIPRPRR